MCYNHLSTCALSFIVCSHLPVSDKIWHLTCAPFINKTYNTLKMEQYSPQGLVYLWFRDFCKIHDYDNRYSGENSYFLPLFPCKYCHFIIIWLTAKWLLKHQKVFIFLINVNYCWIIIYLVFNDSCIYKSFRILYDIKLIVGNAWDTIDFITATMLQCQNN